MTQQEIDRKIHENMDVDLSGRGDKVSKQQSSRRDGKYANPNDVRVEMAPIEINEKGSDLRTFS